MPRSHTTPIEPLPGLPRERQAVAAPLLKRMLEALKQLVSEAPLELLQQAAAAPSGVGSTATLVAHLPAASPRLAAGDPEAAAVARAAQVKQSLLESVATYSTLEVADLLGISSEAIRKRRLAGKLLALPFAGDWRFPAWQFTSPASGKGHGTLVGLEQVLAALPTKSPWVRLELLTTTLDGESSSTIVGMLQAGDVEEAIQIVASYGEHGA
jgi:hypothetical protein